jgi:hypothetical protein
MQQTNTHTEWKLINYTAIAVRKTYDNDSVFSEAQYYLTFSRKYEYYILILVTPICIIVALTVFGLFSPSTNMLERQEKVVLEVFLQQINIIWDFIIL